MKKVKAKSTNQKYLALLVIAGLVVVVLGFNYFSGAKQVTQKVGINEVVPAPQDIATLKIVPANATGAFANPFKLTLDPSYTNTMNIVIDGFTNVLTGATIELNYDPSKITISSVSKGPYFPAELSAPKIDTTGKKVTMSFGLPAADVTTAQSKGSGIVASFVVAAKSPSTTSITFGATAGATDTNATNTTKVIAKGFTTNILTSATGITFVTGGKASADFTDTGDGAITTDPVTGAITEDDQVNEADYNFFLGAFGKTDATSLKADIATPKNSKVDILDYAEFIRQWGL